MDGEIGKPTIIAVIAAVILIILIAFSSASEDGTREPFIKVTPAGAPMNVTVVKVDSARGVVCYGAVDLVLGTTLSCVKVEP